MSIGEDHVGGELRVAGNMLTAALTAGLSVTEDDVARGLGFLRDSAQPEGPIRTAWNPTSSRARHRAEWRPGYVSR